MSSSSSSSSVSASAAEPTVLVTTAAHEVITRTSDYECSSDDTGESSELPSSSSSSTSGLPSSSMSSSSSSSSSLVPAPAAVPTPALRISYSDHDTTDDGARDGDADGNFIEDAAIDPKVADTLIPFVVLTKMKQFAGKDGLLPSLQAHKLKGTDAQKKFFHANFGARKLYYEIEDVDYSNPPDVGSASSCGIRIYFVRWELGFPKFEALCRYFFLSTQKLFKITI